MGDGFIPRKIGGGSEETLPFGPGPQELVAGDLDAGFFGRTTQQQFGTTMTQVMSDLGITQGTAQFTTDRLLKFIHRGKIKYINQKTIRRSISWDHIQARLSADNSGNDVVSGNVYKGAVMTIGGRKYRVRLMRGWGQVSANTNGTGAPNYNTGPLMTISMAFGGGGNNGTNWPNNDSPWNAASPNEWNTLMFPISVDSGTQTQTANTPNWASYSNADLQIIDGNGRVTWVQETVNTSTFNRTPRGNTSLAAVSIINSSYNEIFVGLRLVFELI